MAVTTPWQASSGNRRPGCSWSLLLCPGLLLGAGCRGPAPAAPSKGDDTAGRDTSVYDPGPGDTEQEKVPSAPGSQDWLWSEDQILDYRFTLSEASWAALEKEPETYVEASLLFNDQEYSSVGLRVKGQNSFSPIGEKPALKVKFNEFDPEGRFLGLKSLTLNNMVSDYSMMHERVGYALYRAQGVPASRAMHCHVYVNDEFYGLYTNVETVNEQMIGRWFEDDSGSLYELWDVDFKDRYIDQFQLEEGEDDRTAIQGLSDALEKEGMDALEAAQAYVDLDEFLSYWATSAVIAQFDGYPYSSPGDDCHLYIDPQDNRIHFIPWGVDESFYSPDYNVERVRGILASRCKEVESCRASFQERTWQVLDLAETMDMLGMMSEVQDQIEDSVEADTRKPYPDTYVRALQRSMRELIEDRAQALEGFFEER